MEEDKYYTPQLEDFTVDYEYEEKVENYFNKEMEWVIKRFVEPFNDDTNLSFQIMNGNIRVLYLTKEQIEDEGWKRCIDPKIKNRCNYRTEKDGFTTITMNYWASINRLMLSNGVYGVNNVCYFFGICKSINELRTIMNLVKLNQ